jgi:hypothetical protein
MLARNKTDRARTQPSRSISVQMLHQLERNPPPRPIASSRDPPVQKQSAKRCLHSSGESWSKKMPPTYPVRTASIPPLLQMAWKSGHLQFRYLNVRVRVRNPCVEMDPLLPLTRKRPTPLSGVKFPLPHHPQPPHHTSCAAFHAVRSKHN